jgi:tRNA nucleotidyltransferase (CCA-adding enzyme)
VNLRAEEQYLPNSRIPVVKHFGTPYEDAMRRDFTINALFYNIHTRCIEDYSHRGIHDLKRSIIVTPLSPFTTFHDDPLRVLRAIRFTVRFDFALAEELRLAAQSRRVHESLICKVSRERVGTELEGMLTGKAAKPLRALQLISELGLSDSVFHIGEKEDALMYGPLCISPSLMVGKSHDNNDYEKANDRESYRHLGWKEAKERTHLVEDVLSHFNNTRILPCNASAITTILDERFFLLSAYLSPFKDLMWKDPKKAKVHRAATMSIVKDGIKFKNDDVNALECIMSNQDSFQRILRKLSSNDDDDLVNCISRLEVGLLLREVKQLWVTCLLVSAIAELRMPSNDVKDSDSSKESAASSILQACEQFYSFVAKEQLDGCWKRPPLLNGKAIMKALNLGKRGGPLVGCLIDAQWTWMLQNPLGTQDECEEFLKSSLPGIEARASET